MSNMSISEREIMILIRVLSAVPRPWKSSTNITRPDISWITTCHWRKSVMWLFCWSITWVWNHTEWLCAVYDCIVCLPSLTCKDVWQRTWERSWCTGLWEEKPKRKNNSLLNRQLPIPHVVLCVALSPSLLPTASISLSKSPDSSFLMLSSIDSSVIFS